MWGLVGADRGTGARRGGGGRGDTGPAGREPSVVALLAASLVAEGIGFGGARFLHLDQLAQDPAILLFLAEIAIGLALPFVLLRRGERLRGYVATVVLGVLAGLAIGPVTTLIRGIADRF